MAQVMIAKASGMVPTPKGQGRLMVRKGITTADADADIVRNSPHLWKPVKVDYPGPGGPEAPADGVDDAARSQGADYLDQIRRLAASMEDAGVPMERIDSEMTGAEMAGRVVDAALREMNIDDAGVPTATTPVPGTEQDDENEDGGDQDAAGEGEGEDMGDDGIPVNTGVGTGGVTPLDEEQARAAADAGSEGDAVNVGPGGVGGPQPPEAEDLQDDGDQPDATPEGRARIRQWASENDVEVSPHGKIPSDVVDQYRTAMSGTAVNRGQ